MNKSFSLTIAHSRNCATAPAVMAADMLLPVTVKRNAYGRQLGSFRTEAPFGGKGEIPMVFIRAPYIEKAGEGVEVLAEVDGHIVAVRYKNQIGVSFHPELAGVRAVYEMLFAKAG